MINLKEKHSFSCVNKFNICVYNFKIIIKVLSFIIALKKIK